MDSLFDDLLFELSLDEARAWMDAISLFPGAEALPKNSAEKT